ncbi:MAG: glycine cleavage system aminomethyltransferase GcvT [Candidatus Omnitrophica bacterium]|nr:glycine cleavage system aminomethyltransferase GcvT [Candidatus Omnitrophota bacterium]
MMIETEELGVFVFGLGEPRLNKASEKKIHRLPLYEKHVQRGAKFGVFAGWEVPLYYTSILEEHRAVRQRVGVFDISHMGVIRVSGSGTSRFLEGLLPRCIQTMEKGMARYMPLLNERGGIIDDIIVYCFDRDEFWLVVNAGNADKDFTWIESRASVGIRLENFTGEKGILSIQGPLSANVISRIFDPSFTSLGYYRFQPYGNGMIARTGYTGEDGFEIIVDSDALPNVWEVIFDAGGDGTLSRQLSPVGFGARDTLRLEAGMPLYGHDMDDDTTPYEAGIGWAVDLGKNSFVGRGPLLQQKEAGIRRRLVGFEMVERGIPRPGYKIRKENERIGEVTSGGFAPTLGKNIGMGYVPVGESEPGNILEIVVRGQSLKAVVVSLPFYRRKRK